MLCLQIISFPMSIGWCTTGSASGDDQGWILMQHMPGCDLDTVFEKLSLEEQKPILSQIAEIFAKIQRCEIPSTVEGFGGLTFDERGCMVGGEMSLVRGGPFGTYVELWQGMLREELKCADESEVIAGWRQNGVREKIEAFVEKGVPNMYVNLLSACDIVVHDFSPATNNLLFDEKTAKVTAIIDFDFAHITAPAEEFFRSFWTFGGNVLGGESPSSLIHGFPEPHSETTFGPRGRKVKILG
ncbi:hypothetical protein BT96DRAFT_1100253 [Gymnopus androsaceus JB14]|uniref:Aminoglycoside phosphotransferase domain-containing protein n=1 Tax=Gymnopus androsaceus JB14 TaxID=1447944 RepID=A0A6A4HQI7_9AGAR|nr:hypothetical protein BT96DRAFT_1100253 [Gymnopus androsaceus JB14]